MATVALTLDQKKKNALTPNNIQILFSAGEGTIGILSPGQITLE